MIKIVNARIANAEVERVSFAAAAELTGLDLPAWVRTTLRAAAKKELKDSGEIVPFLDK